MGPACQAVKKRREERRERERREQTARSAGHQRDEGSLCFSSPGIVEFSNLLLFINWRCEGAAGWETPGGRTMRHNGGMCSRGGG